MGVPRIAPAIVRYLGGKSEPLGYEAIAQAIGFAPKYVRLTLKNLVRSGQVRRTGERRAARYELAVALPEAVDVRAARRSFAAWFREPRAGSRVRIVKVEKRAAA